MDQSAIISFGTLIGSFVTAVATIFLWLVTRTLAAETKRMVEASAQPHVVATIEPSKWSMRHLDLTVSNTGNATAYDITLKFEPATPPDAENLRDGEYPFRNISVLRPGQSMMSYLGEFASVKDRELFVEIDWVRDKVRDARETNRYSINLANLQGMSRLGPSEPLVQIAEDIRKMRDDWRSVAGGSRRLSADIFTEADREKAREELHEHWREAQRAEEERLAQRVEPPEQR